jgi:hypothetical protein
VADSTAFSSRICAIQVVDNHGAAGGVAEVELDAYHR